MIPEPDNKKGAFAPFHNRTVVIVNIVCTLKLPSNMQSKFQIIVPITKASAFALLFLSAGGRFFSPETSSHSEP